MNQIQNQQPDEIKRPSHYCDGRIYEPKDVIRDWGLNYNLGSAVKYISRAGRKDSTIKDLQKAVTYLEFEIEALQKEEGDDIGDFDVFGVTYVNADNVVYTSSQTIP